MKRILVLFVGVAMALSSQAAIAEDSRYFQYSGKDTTHPTEMDPEFRVSSVQFAITSDGYAQVFILTQKPVDSSKFQWESVSNTSDFAGLFDLDSDGRAEYVVSAWDVTYQGSTKVEVSLNWVGQNETLKTKDTCPAWTWVTDSRDSVAFEFSMSCIKWKPQVSLVGLSSQLGIYDQFPEEGSFFKVKTNYLAGFPCTKSRSNKRVTYLDDQFICVQKSGKWVNINYNEVLASKAKYTTEKAFYVCKLGKTPDLASLADKGKTVILDRVGKSVDATLNYNCVNRMLSTPASVTSQIGMTRPIDGLQKASWGKFNAVWTYGSDDGLSITYISK